MKKLKALILTIVLVFSLVVIVGCEKNDEQSEELTSGKESNISATSNTVSLSEIEIRQRTMKIEYLKFRGVEDITEKRIKEVSIKSYGTFGDYEAVMFKGLSASGEIIEIEVYGYNFQFPSSEKLFIFDGEMLTEFNQAFEEGKLTIEDIEQLHKQFEAK